MRARIKLTRIHQINGPDYWQADCYFQDYSFRTKGTTQQKALNKMFVALDRHGHYDWYMAHAMNSLYDLRKRQQENLFRFSVDNATTTSWKRTMSQELEKTKQQIEEVVSRSEEPKGISHWLKKLIK